MGIVSSGAALNPSLPLLHFWCLSPVILPHKFDPPPPPTSPCISQNRLFLIGVGTFEGLHIESHEEHHRRGACGASLKAYRATHNLQLPRLWQDFLFSVGHQLEADGCVRVSCATSSS